MSETVAVVNSSPLIILSRAGLLDVLRQAGNRVLVPDPVMTELQCRGSDDIAVRAVRSNPWLRIVPSAAITGAIAAWDLGEGESSVIACATSIPGSVAVLDDLQARRCAESLGLTVRGTLGLIALAKKNGAITNAGNVITAVRQAGLYVSERLVAEVLRLAGE